MNKYAAFGIYLLKASSEDVLNGDLKHKKPPLGGYDITTYCFDYSVFLFPGTRGGT